MNASISSLSSSLQAHVRALSARVPGSVAMDAAQRRLDDVVNKGRIKVKRRRITARLSAACAGAAALGFLVLVLPALFTGQGVAFAAVQKHLRDFKTLTMTVTQSANGAALPTIHVWADRRGDARTDIGTATSVIVNAGSGTMLTLLHGSHQAMRMSIGTRGATQGTPALGWLKSVRQFQGHAERLPGTRMLDGKPTHGWSLRTHGMHIVLWADDDGMPRAVNINGVTTLTQRIHLSLDTPIDAARFSTEVPAGYTLMQKSRD